MKPSRKIKVILIHNTITPYRQPLFTELNRYVSLQVFYCRRKTRGRKWRVDLDGHSFKYEILKSFAIGPLLINYTLPFKLLVSRADVYIVGENPNTLFASFVTLFFARLFNKGYVLWSGAIDTEYAAETTSLDGLGRYYKRISRRIATWYQKILYRHTNAFVAYGRKARAYLMSRGVPGEKIFMGGQIMPQTILPLSGIEKDRTEYRDKLVILFVGYLLARKGVDYLIRAFQNIQDKKTVLLIAGGGPDRQRLQSLVNKTDKIAFLGYVDRQDRAKYYAIADIFVLPTLHDPWGHVVTEAMYYGLPIITTSAAGAEEIVKKSGCGLVVKPGDVGELTKALRLLQKDKSLRAAMSDKAKAFTDNIDLNKGLDPFRQAIDYVLV